MYLFQIRIPHPILTINHQLVPAPAPGLRRRNVFDRRPRTSDTLLGSRTTHAHPVPHRVLLRLFGLRRRRVSLLYSRRSRSRSRGRGRRGPVAVHGPDPVEESHLLQVGVDPGLVVVLPLDGPLHQLHLPQGLEVGTLVEGETLALASLEVLDQVLAFFLRAPEKQGSKVLDLCRIC